MDAKLSLFQVLLMCICAGAIAQESIDPSRYTGERWFGLYLNKGKVGFMQQVLSIGEGGQVLFTEEGTFRMNMGGVNQEMKVSSVRTYAHTGELIAIDYTLVDLLSTTEFHARVENNQLKLVKKMAGQSVERYLPLPQEKLRDAIKFQLWMEKKPKVGEEWISFLFEPLYEQELTCISTIAGTEERLFNGVLTKLYKIHTKVNVLNLEQTSYVTEDGLVLEDIAGEIFTMRLEPKEVATDVNYSNDVLVSNAAIIDKPIKQPRERDYLKLLLKGPLKENHLFCDERQQIITQDENFVFTAKRIQEDTIPKLTFPIQDEEMKRWAEPGSFIQSDHPDMVKTAQSIIGDTKDAWEAVKKICSWVKANMKTSYSAQLTNALDVLKHREGDCTEHSLLFVGLCRAVGIPAREVAGLIYVDSPKPGFYFHQWEKVWVGKWIDVDPTFNQPLVDVTHIKIGEGDIIDQIKLIPVVGRIQITLAEE